MRKAFVVRRACAGKRGNLTGRAAPSLLMNMGLWPVRCAPVGSVAVGSVLWRFEGQLHVTAIVKATYAMPETGEMTRINPQPIRRSDDYLHGLPSLAGASEIAPRLSESGAVVIGHAYSPSPDGVKKRSIRFTIVRRNTLLVDKTLYVYGDRVKGGAPKRFTKMHVGYERALGGIDFSSNPVGVGMEKGSNARPNVIDPKDPKRAVGGFGPVPARFPRRRRRLGDVKAATLESGLVELPAGFDWDYFQAAPRDQRLERIRGDEWLMLEGMHRDHPRLRVRIPKARALAKIYRKKNVAAPEMLELACDTLHIEPDFDRCSLIWRADFPVASELAASALVIAGAVQEGQEPVAWPPSVDELEDIASPVRAGKPLPGPRGQPLFSTAVSEGVDGADKPRRAPPPPPRRRKRTPPPAIPPPTVPPPPAWRPSWNEFPAVSGAAPSGHPVSSQALSSDAYPSYPGVPRDPLPSYPQQPVTSPTGTIPAPPPDDEVPDPMSGLDRTEMLSEENPFEKTDPLDDDGEDDSSEWTVTRVDDETS